MKLMLDVDIKPPAQKINYNDSIFLIGSCFTEHIGKRLDELKFPVLQNPNGILFDPISVTQSLNSYIDNKNYDEGDLFFLNDLWQSWCHHSVFSGMDAKEVLANINRSQAEAHNHLKTATWLIITLGSSFSYSLHESKQPVANCHRAPAQWFNKNLLPTEETATRLSDTIQRLKLFNPGLKIIFTISPVRHFKTVDGFYGVEVHVGSRTRLTKISSSELCLVSMSLNFIFAVCRSASRAAMPVLLPWVS